MQPTDIAATAPWITSPDWLANPDGPLPVLAARVHASGSVQTARLLFADAITIPRRRGPRLVGLEGVLALVLTSLQGSTCNMQEAQQGPGEIVRRALGEPARLVA
ncbi:MAG TPA: hypothetical protein PLA44_06860 [Propionibacteriaceae bacterium]|nr:hypothetical protein [Propionibacteriaceae bacterium]